MGRMTPFTNGFFPPSNSFQDPESCLEILESLHVHEISRRPPMLGDQNWEAILLESRNDLGSFPLEVGYQFRLPE